MYFTTHLILQQNHSGQKWASAGVGAAAVDSERPAFVFIGNLAVSDLAQFAVEVTNLVLLDLGQRTEQDG